MSDRTYAKTHAQQKTLIGSSPGGRLLQRTCVCRQHTIAGAQCPTCSSNQSTLLRSQRTLGSPSTFSQENAASVNSGSGGVSHFGHDFSQIPIHSTTQVPRGILSTEEYSVQLGVPVHRVPASSRIMDVVQHAATDNSRSMNPSVGPLNRTWDTISARCGFTMVWPRLWQPNTWAHELIHWAATSTLARRHSS